MRKIQFLGAVSAALLFAYPAFCAPVVAVVAASADALVLAPAKAGRVRPIIAIAADSAGAQTTDFIIPYSILKDANVADVRSVSTHAGSIKMTRGLTIVADETLAAFDAQNPAGADIVIIPAQARPDSRELIAWVQAQAAKGATIVSICEGSRVLAKAGLLDNKRATTHWASLDAMSKEYPNTTWVRDRRYVQDGKVITTAGVTASIPASLALVAAIGGAEVSARTATRVGVAHWSANHRTSDYAISKGDITVAKLGMADKFTHQTIEIPLEEGIDEMAIALETEAWGRTYRNNVVTTRAVGGPIRSMRGLTIVPDGAARAGSFVLAAPTRPAVKAFEATLAEIGRRYGPGVQRLVTVPMEYDASNGIN